MNTSLKIEEFSSLLKSNEASPLLAALRKLTEIEKPEAVVEVVSEGLSWGWG